MAVEIKKYKKKPVQVEAVQIPNIDDEEDAAEIIEWGHGKLRYDDETYPCSGPVIGLETSTGHHYACPGDWIIKGIDGTFYATTDDTFQKLYEEADTDVTTNNGVITW